MEYGEETDDENEDEVTALHNNKKEDTQKKTEASSTKSATTTDLSWLEVKDLFAALDACNFETVGFREFCAQIFLLAALHDNQLLECLYQHGVLLFDILGGG